MRRKLVVKGAIKTISKQKPGLFDYENRMRKLEEDPDPLSRLNARIDWEMFRPNLERAFEKEAEGARRSWQSGYPDPCV